MPNVRAASSTLTRAERAKPRVAVRVLGVLIVVAVTVLSLELTVRFVADNGMQFDLEMWKYARDVKVVSDNPRIGHKHGPNRRATLMGVEVQTNSRGLRDREFSFERAPDTRRIVMLGDSITEGWGVPIDETFSKRIERLYGKGGINADVINTGVGNWNTVQEVEFFLTEAYQYHPDIVVLNYFVNDAEALPRSETPSILARHCYSCTFLLGRLDSIRRQLATRQEWSDYYLALYEDGKSPSWLAAKDAIKRLADYCRAHDVRLLVASVPELHDVKQYRFERVTQLVRDAAVENGVGFVDLLPDLSKHDSAALWVTPPDPHPNAFANQLIATGLFHALEALDSGLRSPAGRSSAYFENLRAVEPAQ